MTSHYSHLNQANSLLHVEALAAEAANSIYVVLRGKILHFSPNMPPQIRNYHPRNSGKKGHH